MVIMMGMAIVHSCDRMVGMAVVEDIVIVDRIVGTEGIIITVETTVDTATGTVSVWMMMRVQEAIHFFLWLFL